MQKLRYRGQSAYNLVGRWRNPEVMLESRVAQDNGGDCMKGIMTASVQVGIDRKDQGQM